MGHRNNLFTNSLIAKKRVNKKLLRWALDLDEYGSRLKRQWIRGVDNVLSDCPSRNPVDRDETRSVTVPSGPIKRVIERMFRSPDALEQGIQELEAAAEFETAFEGVAQESGTWCLPTKVANNLSCV